MRWPLPYPRAPGRRFVMPVPSVLAKLQGMYVLVQIKSEAMSKNAEGHRRERGQIDILDGKKLVENTEHL